MGFCQKITIMEANKCSLVNLKSAIRVFYIFYVKLLTVESSVPVGIVVSIKNTVPFDVPLPVLASVVMACRNVVTTWNI